MPQCITLAFACAANALLIHCSHTACVLSGGSRVAAAGHAVRALARPGGEEKKRRPSLEQDEEEVGDHSPPLALTLASTASSSRLDAAATLLPPPSPLFCHLPAQAKARPCQPPPCGACRTTKTAAPRARVPRGWTGLSCDVCLRAPSLLGRRVRRARHAHGGRCLPVRSKVDGSGQAGPRPRGHVGDGAAPPWASSRDAQQPGLPVAATPPSGGIAVLTRGLQRGGHPPLPAELGAELIQLNLTNLEMATICPASNHASVWKPTSHATAAAAAAAQASPSSPPRPAAGCSRGQPAATARACWQRGAHHPHAARQPAGPDGGGRRWTQPRG